MEYIIRFILYLLRECVYPECFIIFLFVKCTISRDPFHDQKFLLFQRFFSHLEFVEMQPRFRERKRVGKQSVVKCSVELRPVNSNLQGCDKNVLS